LHVGDVYPRTELRGDLGQRLSVRDHPKVSNVSESDIKMGPGSVIVGSPRTLKYYTNPQILDKGMEDRLE